MKPFLILILLWPNVACTGTKNLSADTAKTVYLCGSGKGKKYHFHPNCRGLSNCSYKIIKTTLTKAKKEGKTLCKWED